MKILSFFISVVFTLPSFARETVSGAPRNGLASTHSSLPLCVGDPKEVDAIMQAEQPPAEPGPKTKVKPPNPNKYKAMRVALSASSNEELVNRIVYSETLAANCPSFNQKLAPLIRTVIENRIRADGDAKKTIFKENQFASSLNNYTPARFKDFLCPGDESLWNLVSNSHSLTSLPTNANYYYLYEHAPEKFKPSGRALQEGIKLGESEDFNKCFKVFADKYP